MGENARPAEADETQELLLRIQAGDPLAFDELFERLWSNFDLLTRPKAERLESLNVDVPLTTEEAREGG